MADFTCDRECTYRSEKECMLGLPGLNGIPAMPGFCHKLQIKQKENLKYEMQI